MSILPAEDAVEPASASTQPIASSTFVAPAKDTADSMSGTGNRRTSGLSAAIPSSGSEIGSVSSWFWKGIFLALGACVIVYWDSFSWMAQTWLTDSDYSHGFFVAPFAVYVWSMRKQSLAALREVKENSTRSIAVGIGLMAAALALRALFRYVRMETPEALTFLMFVLGGLVLYFGTRSIPIVFSGVLFLVFMVPLPGSLASQLSGVLQNVATQVSTFAFQTIGIPAFAQGNVISLTTGQIGVAEACSGIRMLYSFFALTFGACLIMERTLLEKVVISALAPILAVAANCLRIIATGVAFEYGDPKSAEHFFHDIAGWFMMPVGFALLLGVLAILDRVLEVDPPMVETSRS